MSDPLQKTISKRRPWRRLVLAVLACALLGGGLYARNMLDDLTASLPPVPDLLSLPVSAEVVDRNGELLRPFTTPDGRWRLPVTIGEVDPLFVKMLIGYEDQHFMTHNGIDWASMLRAAGQLASAGHIVSGGSTLTMQVARLIDQGSTRSPMAKLRQMLFAQKLERTLSKAQILTLYLTLAPYGGNIEGIRAASLSYFGKEPARLSIAQAALLVALPQSPEARRPDRDVSAAMAARNNVLDRAQGAGLISAEDAATAKAEIVPALRQDFPLLAAHLTQRAIAAQPRARRIGLSLDAHLQKLLEELSASRAGQLGPKVSIAILVADQASGRILASVGSAGLFADARAGYVDMTEAVRSPGSTLKPLIYGLGFELGLAHPESLIEDRPTAFGAYVPVNFDGLNRGTVTVRQALAQSRNIPAVMMLDAVGPARLVARLQRAGVHPVLPNNSAPSLAMGLGGVGMTLRDLVALYAAIARGGTPVALTDGLSAPIIDPRAPVLDAAAAWYVTDILRGVPPPLNGLPGRIAYKTGTSYGYRDAWAIGYDGKNVIGVWVGRPDGAPVTGITGLGSAAPILFESFDRLGGDTAPFRPPPPGVLMASNAELPLPLQRFRNRNENMVASDPAPEIAFPADGVDVDLGLAAGAGMPLTVKIRNGAPPFTFFANGAPFGRSEFAQQENWVPDGPGYVTLSVVDAKGRSDQVTVFLN